MRDYLAAALAVAAVAQGAAPAIDYLSAAIAAREADHKRTEAAAEAVAHPELLRRDCAIAWGAK